MTELKSCPFCSGNVELDCEHVLQGDVRYYIWCPECHMEFTKSQWWNGYEESKIIEEWNRRVNE